MPCENDPFKKYIQGFDGKVDNQSNPDDVTELSQLFREIFPDTSDHIIDNGIMLINPSQTFIGHNQIVPSDEQDTRRYATHFRFQRWSFLYRFWTSKYT